MKSSAEQCRALETVAVMIYVGNQNRDRKVEKCKRADRTTVGVDVEPEWLCFKRRQATRGKYQALGFRCIVEKGHALRREEATQMSCNHHNPAPRTWC